VVTRLLPSKSLVSCCSKALLGGFFILLVSLSGVLAQAPESSKSKSEYPADAAVSEAARVLLGSLSTEEAAQFLGAYRYGYKYPKVLSDGIVLFRLVREDVKHADSNREVDFLISFSTPRKNNFGSLYRSVITQGQYDCVKKTIEITYQQFQANPFATGSAVGSYATKEKGKLTLPSKRLAEMLSSLYCHA